MPSENATTQQVRTCREGGTQRVMAVAVNVTLSRRDREVNHYQLLTWLNESLQTCFTKVEHICSTGTAFCQLMDWLFPGSLELSRVRFQSTQQADVIHNYHLLQAAFLKTGVTRYVPKELLMKMDLAVCLAFLQWFKAFFDINHKGREYHALKARGGQSMAAALDCSTDERPVKKVELMIKIADKAQNGVKEKLILPRQVILETIDLTSDEDDDRSIEEVVEGGRKAEVEREGLNRERERTEEECCSKVQKDEEMEEGVKMKRTQEEASASRRRERLKYLIGRYGATLEEGAEPPVSHFLAPTHPRDIALACSNTPYCLYLYEGVEMEDGLTASIMLIGYFDQSSGVEVLRLLDTRPSLFNMSVHVTTGTDEGARVHVKPGTDESTCVPVSHSLVKTLLNFGLSLYNLAVFYCDSPDPGVSQQLESQLRVFRPGLLSLCGLPGLVERSCHAGLTSAFASLVGLVKKIHCHFTNCGSSVRNGLREMFASVGHYCPSTPISTQCLFFRHMVQKMARNWQDLEDYFESLAPSEDARQISVQLRLRDVRLGALFLCHALQPLCAFEEVYRSDSATLAAQLQLVAALSHSYAARVLQSSGLQSYLHRPNAAVLRDEKMLRPASELEVGTLVSEYLLSTSEDSLEKWEWAMFLGNVVTFSRAVLESLAKSIPEQLGYTTLQNISLLLRPPQDVTDLESRSLLMKKLCVHLGLSSPGSRECQGLTAAVVGEWKFDSEEEEDEEWQRKAVEEQHWVKVLGNMRKDSLLRTLLLILLALPRCLNRERVLAKVFSSRASVDPRALRRKDLPKIPDRREVDAKTDELSSPTDDEEQEEEERNEEMEEYESDSTDNSSDVVDITDELDHDTIGARKKWGGTTSRAHMSEVVNSPSLIVIMDTNEDMEAVTTTLTQHTAAPPEVDVGPRVAELVWGCPVKDSPLWPGIIQAQGKEAPTTGLVEWYGRHLYSEVSLQSLRPFADFTQCFSAYSFATMVAYREAIFRSLQEVARRCSKQFSESSEDPAVVLRVMLDWAFGGFQPTGPDGFKPTPPKHDTPKVHHHKPKKKRRLSRAPSGSSRNNDISVQMKKVSVWLERLSFSQLHEGGVTPPGKRKEKRVEGKKEVKRGRGRPPKKKPNGLLQKFEESPAPDFLPPYKKKALAKAKEPTNYVYIQPDQRHREEIICRIKEESLDIETFCLCCGVADIDTFHPLFKGSLCLKCKDNFTATLYTYADDGYQAYCTICCYGLEVLLCGNVSCCRSFCLNCLDILVGPGTFVLLKDMDPWICYLCQPLAPHGALVPREDWSLRVQEFFANNSGMEFEPHRVYPSIPANLRRPIRVLSLFDGIGTGYLVLKDLGFKVETYVASEICEDSIAVSSINHDGRIEHVDDVRCITKEHIKKWGPFDLLIGGSPCNDLSIVNPFRKGLFEGSGRLFFDFYRILHLLKPKEDDPRPFFWLFENVVFMNTRDKVNICRFLECNPVLVDAVKVSPAHRARYFWGNIPGMNRPITASENDKLSLQDCLERGREAKFTKVRTITTQSNSLKQGKVALFPVMDKHREDNLWITELEKIFGFPKHYTDVRNMSRQQRQKVLGKSWSVPVIRHLFAPLKDYFSCEELPGSSTFQVAPDCSN